MKVLITGAGGFIGSQLALRYSQHNHQVFAICRSTVPEKLKQKNITIINTDLAESTDLLPPADLVIHGAAQTHLDPLATTASYTRNNIQASLNMAHYLKNNPPQCLINLSTLSVYGTVNTSTLTEEQPLNAPNSYGSSKYFCEQIMQELSSTIPTLSIRLPGVIAQHYFEPWLGRTLQAMFKNENITFYNGHCRFNNVMNIKGIYRLISDVLTSRHTGYALVNLAASQALSLTDLVTKMLHWTDSQSIITNTKSEQQSFSIDTQKLQRLFLHTPQTTEDIVHNYIISNQ
ncbi:MAG: NAD(P)-dependent oxidoreductase [Spongiibacteraceae bacterium]|nr:NAD(P)-dependent oxidoreductase [Spongiibacteraceae bacterium]